MDQYSKINADIEMEKEKTQLKKEQFNTILIPNLIVHWQGLLH